ncbi:MAG TPA: HPr family phosphocarrier protein [Candidatus Acetatifactor stercoripullorum]|uniref:HPr family phosphocarrier protein n=1 Tax=Candidatus Acetatifactor stercoripullorum TaxID=2838414 RepID=A0A9D1R4Z8_9FIRM|nr:HPr family phosphocarrier protein [uncultured Acetatifactor sp.]HIW81603.1 HPr family phosphocarrier protein [Candidatus Acetatifactor stercoripullorum]
MKQFEYTITDELGIHARPAGLLVKKAGEFASTVTIDNGQKKADAKKLISLMMLAVKMGQTVKFIIEGADEDKAAAVLETFMKENL